MQMNGYFNPRDEPVIVLTVGSSRIEVLVDTGFNGSLIIPTSLARTLELGFERGLAEFCSVTGEVFLASPCSREIGWFGQRIKVSVAACAEVKEAILGSQMLKDCRLTIDYNRRTVSIRESYQRRSG
jgi:clan AA aspartic protease